MIHSATPTNDAERLAALRNAVVDAALECIVMIDSAGTIIDFNPAAERTFGRFCEEVVGTPLYTLITPEDMRTDDALKRHLETGNQHKHGRRIETPSRNANNQDIWLELSMSAIEVSGQTYFSVHLRDITQDRAARESKERLRLSEQRFQMLFEMSADAIFVHDVEGTILDVNDRAVELFGHTKEALIGGGVKALHPTSAQTKVQVAFARVNRDGHVRMEIPFLRANGEVFQAEVVARKVETPEGEICHGIVRDITERLAAETDLRKAKNEAERANAAKTDFLANMSHEMRTPLNGVLGSLSLISRSGLTKTNKQFLTAAENSAETLLTLIDDLLDLSRIEAGEVEIEPVVFEVGRFAQIIDELFGPSAMNKNIELKVNQPEQTVFLKADAGRIRQVLINLVGNAMKFTNDGSIEVSLTVDKKNTETYFNIEVVDTGIGVDPSVQSNLFDRFKQADSSRAKRHGGAGLGLAICKELTELMSGEIGVTSIPGEGARFWLKVPVEAAFVAEVEPEVSVTDSAPIRGRVLLAEDSPTNAAVASKMLECFGLDFEHVVDGQAAIDAAQDRHFDLILMDIGMPVIDGLEATRRLVESGFDKPIIAMTAHALRGDRQKAIAAGMSGYVTKPVKFDALFHELSNWLSDEDEASADQNNVNISKGGIDNRSFQSMWKNDGETYAHIAHIFLEELSARLSAISSAELCDLKRQAHSLKGAAANVCANRLSELSAQLEESCTQGNSTTSEALRVSVLEEATRVSLEISRILSEL